MNKTSILLATGVLFLAACGDKDSQGTGEIPNTAPVANAGPDIAVSADDAVNLSGAASYDEEGDALTYVWSFEYVPDGSALMEAGEDAFFPNNSGEAVTTSFSPDAVGTYVVALKVHDTYLWSSADYVVINAETPESRPIADAGDDIQATQDSEVCLDGSKSYDPQGLGLSYAWSVVSVPELSSLTQAGITGADTATPCFTADARNVYTFSLMVSNGLTTSTADSVNVRVVGENGIPTADAGPDFEGDDCSFHQLDGSGSVDPDGESLSYFWEIQGKPTGSQVTNEAAFSDRNAVSPTFYPDISGVYHLSLSVRDSSGDWSSADTVIATINERGYNSVPVIDIPTPDSIEAGYACCEPSGYIYDCDECSNQSITLGDGVTVNDPDGDPMTYSWELISGEGYIDTATALVSGARLENIEPTEPEVCDANEFEFQLTVTDCTGESTVATVIYTANCCGADESDTHIDCTTSE